MRCFLWNCRSAVLLVLGAVTMAAGCGEAGSSMPAKLVPVTGTITADGQPLKHAAVSFIPEAAKQGVGAFGSTDESGKYDLKWHGSGEGVAPGKYKVVVSRMTQKDGSPVPPDQSAADVGAVESMPPRYSDVNVTELLAEVTPTGSTHDFKLVVGKKK